MNKRKPPKNFKNLPEGTKKFIKEAEKKNRLAEALVPKTTSEDPFDILKTMMELIQDPIKYDEICKKIDADVEKEFK
jgi:hypothetical protein